MMAARRLGGSSMRSYLTSIKVEPVPGAPTPITVTVSTGDTSFMVALSDDCYILPIGDDFIMNFD